MVDTGTGKRRISSAACTLGDKGDWRLNQIDRQQLIIPYAAAPLIDAKTYPVVTKSDAALLKILRIVHSQQAPGIDFPRRRAGPSGQIGYRSWSVVHTRAGNRTSDNRFSVPAQCR